MSEGDPTLVTRLLREARAGDGAALDRALPLVYDELRRIAGRLRRGGGSAETLNTTALVHEAYVKLAGGGPQDFRDRAHFLAVAATAMRHILIDHARARGAAKRGGGARPIELDELEAVLAGDTDTGFTDTKADALLELDRALDRLAERSERQMRIVECRFFAGMSIPETAEALAVSPATVKRGWTMAQAWLYRELAGAGAAAGE
jgi:RNA polymerase sigma factor (TIGR02999 family)